MGGATSGAPDTSQPLGLRTGGRIDQVGGTSEQVVSRKIKRT